MVAVSDWHTNTGEVMDACGLFDPEPIEVPPATEVPLDIAVYIDVEEVAFEQVTSLPPHEEELSSSSMTVDGRQALRRETRSTGGGFLPEGVVACRYYVDLDGETLIAQSHDLGEPPFETKRSVLDEMMQTLTFQ